MAALRDLCCAVRVRLRKSSRDKERALYMRSFERRDQIFKAIDLRAAIEGERDLVRAVWAAIDLAKLSYFRVVDATILLVRL